VEIDTAGVGEKMLMEQHQILFVMFSSRISEKWHPYDFYNVALPLITNQCCTVICLSSQICVRVCVLQCQFRESLFELILAFISSLANCRCLELSPFVVGRM